MFSLMNYRYKNEIPVAVKIVPPSRTYAVSIEHKEKFQNEVMFLSSVKHDNIVKVKRKRKRTILEFSVLTL